MGSGMIASVNEQIEFPGEVLQHPGTSSTQINLGSLSFPEATPASGSVSNSNDQPPTAANRTETLRGVLQAFGTVFERLESVATGAVQMETGMGEMEQFLQMVQAATALDHENGSSRPARPPVSRKAFRALPRYLLTDSDVAPEGGSWFGSICAVCTEAVCSGDELIALPCNHSFHVICVKPWLEQRSNSCPVCRREMMTDDPAYEAKKEAEKEEEEERRGAANAVDRLEFLYV
eukprot:CAMPEP_0175053500 /NCGR_PEP_ID=MMETSP0052_2-20121109/8962_1 /TAXON_ID=51329 ORGANISM="Polytomella parva, Strain SAG 63-3" /NCGR_SAMPLE_ID=MMETSP0052_2 /ASSEMBLY_ACC=CAM_ASM_000194 /LENGTH=233 /DNA_ID=CAMNT_0016318047 /DNA_START=325 /DNA_END=1026 /DNA_ORIENTATION=-